MTDLVHLRAPCGPVIAFTLPLHEAIEHQWRNGELERVCEDGSPWGGDGTPEGLSVPPPEFVPAEDDATPARPADSAAKKAWQDHAVALGAVAEDEAAGMTRADLIARCTPPELDPLAKEA